MDLKVLQTGEPVLRTRARELTPGEVVGPAVQQLVVLMRDTLRDIGGVGLAAPQVGVDVRLVIVVEFFEGA
jgi:peptide deformylase